MKVRTETHNSYDGDSVMTMIIMMKMMIGDNFNRSYDGDDDSNDHDDNSDDL